MLPTCIPPSTQKQLRRESRLPTHCLDRHHLPPQSLLPPLAQSHLPPHSLACLHQVSPASTQLCLPVHGLACLSIVLPDFTYLAFLHISSILPGPYSLAHLHCLACLHIPLVSPPWGRIVLIIDQRLSLPLQQTELNQSGTVEDSPGHYLPLWCKADCQTQSLQVVHLIRIFSHGALEKYSKIPRAGECTPW